jgi:hypothetical protein
VEERARGHMSAPKKSQDEVVHRLLQTDEAMVHTGECRKARQSFCCTETVFSL